MLKKIFLSYASEDGAWKDNFTADKIFRDVIGHDVSLEDYRDAANFGPIGEWLDSKINSAAAIILFISEHYITKRYTQAEFKNALGRSGHGRLVFVPVMMDAAAVSWWMGLKEAGRLDELKSEDGSSYAFAEFTRGGKRQAIVSDGRFNDEPAQRIIELARLIKERLGPSTRRPDPETEADGGAARPQPEPPPNGAAKPVVLLGHPTADMPQDIAAAAANLHHDLIEAGVAVDTWADRWSAQAQTYRAAAARLLEQDPMFVQPVGPGEAGELAENSSIVRDRIRRVVGRETPAAAKVDPCRLFLWLPQGLRDPDFAAARPPLPTILSQETTAELTGRITHDAGIRPAVPVIMLEDLSENPPLRSRLQRLFRNVVEQEVAPPIDTYGFAADESSGMLEQQIAGITGDRVILAIHDLNVGPARRMVDARKALDVKLSAYTERVKKAQRSAGRENLKLFWSTLVIRNDKLLPFVRHPSPEFEEWHLLSFVPGNDNDIFPEPTRTRIFRSYLKEWAQGGA